MITNLVSSGCELCMHVVLLCTSKLGVGLFDITQSCDQLLAGDRLLILQQVPVTATRIITFIFVLFLLSNKNHLAAAGTKTIILT